MPRPMTHPPALALPPELDPDQLPCFAARDHLAAIHTKYFGPISPRTIGERWPLEWREVNGRLVSDVRIFLTEAKRRFDAAPVVRGGHNEIERSAA